MARIAENTVIVDGQEYKPGDVIPDFKSIKCVDTREPRKYQGLSADVSVLNDVIAKYASGGASCFMSDTGEYYEYDRKEKTWKLITNITERGFDSEKAYGALKHMLKNVTVSDEKIQSAVTNYLTVNPVLPGATTEQAQQIEQNKTDVASLKTETGSLKKDLDNFENQGIHSYNTDFVSSAFQFINPNIFLNGYYYTESGSIQNDDYSIYPPLKLGIGKYYCYGDVNNFCFFNDENVERRKIPSHKGYIQQAEYFFELNIEKETVIYLTRYKASQIVIATKSIGSDNQKLPSYGYFGEKKLFDFSIDEMENDIKTLKDNTIVFDYQFLNYDEKTSSSAYWSDLDTHDVGSEYSSYLPVSIPKGTYFTHKISPNFTFIKNSEYTKPLTEYSGFSGNADDGFIALDSDCVVYATSYNSTDANKAYISTCEIKEYHYGKFNERELDLKLVDNISKIYYVGKNREFTKIKDAVSEAIKNKNSIIYLDAETFDLVQEFGIDYLNNYKDDEMIGIFLSNGVHIIGSSGSKIVFDYNGTNTNIHNKFAPFNAGENGFILENVTIESKNCRYSVHDERGHSADSYCNKYLRCTMIHDSSNCSWGAHQVIGGGLGQYGDILIEDGYYKSVGCEDNISYHNTTLTGESDAQSKIVIRGAYIDGTTLCANYGTSKKKTQMYINGCSLGLEPKLEKVITDERVDNMEVIAWGNTIRTN